MLLRLPELSLVVLVGPSGCGKSTFARTHFGPFEVVSSDYCRGLVSNDENDQAATGPAFELLHDILRKRLALGKLTVVDATNVRPEDRKPLVELARRYHVLPVAVVFDLPERLCHDRNHSRPDRDFGPHVVRNQKLAMHRGLRGLQREGFRHVFRLRTEAEVAAASVERQPLWNNKKHEHGPFDVVGDVHGCFEELVDLLALLGYRVDEAQRDDGLRYVVTPPQGRKLVFVGDLVDRGPRVPDALRLVMGAVADGVAHCVPGNHDIKLMRWRRAYSYACWHCCPTR